MITQTKGFTLGGLTRTRVENQLKDFLAHFLQACSAIENFAAIDIHVFDQLVIHRCVGRELDGG